MLIVQIGQAVFVYLGYTKVSLIRYENLANMFMGIGLFLFIMMGIGLFLFIMCLDRLNKFNRIKDNFIGKAILSLSLCSYAVYFSHTIVVKELSYHNPGSNMLFPVMFMLVVFLSWLLPYVLSKIPYVKTFSGV